MSTAIDVNGIIVVNEFDVRGKQIRDLIHQYIPGLGRGYYGFRHLGASDLEFPCFHVEPVFQDPKMITTGKYEIKLSYTIWWFVIENDSENIVSLSTSAAESLIKLFSNNALNDLGSGNSNKFKAYSGFWIDSEMGQVEIIRSIVNPIPNRSEKFMRAGRMRFDIQDVVIK